MKLMKRKQQLVIQRMHSKCNTIGIEIIGYYNQDTDKAALTKTYRGLHNTEFSHLTVLLISHLILICRLLPPCSSTSVPKILTSSAWSQMNCHHVPSSKHEDGRSTIKRRIFHLRDTTKKLHVPLLFTFYCPEFSPMATFNYKRGWETCPS